MVLKEKSSNEGSSGERSTHIYSSFRNSCFPALGIRMRAPAISAKS